MYVLEYFKKIMQYLDHILLNVLSFVYTFLFPHSNTYVQVHHNKFQVTTEVLEVWFKYQ